LKNKSFLRNRSKVRGFPRRDFTAAAAKGKKTLSLCCLPVLQLLPVPALAAPAAKTADTIFPMAGLRLIIALGLVLGIFLLFYALSRKGFNLMPKSKSGIIQVKEMRSLGPKKALCLVEVRGQEMLLGVGADRVELISKMGPSVQKPSFEDEVQAQFEGLK
jgi:flagellar protein FliO/FliZ